MLVVPWIAGVLIAGFRWPHLPLLGAWLAGYLLSYYVMQAVKTRRPQHFRTQLLVYGMPTVLLGALVLVLRLQLLWFAPVYAVLLAINAIYAWRRKERALVNDLASVLQSSVMLLVAGVVSGVPIAEMSEPFIVVLNYFTGTVFYVKTMIRERDSLVYRRVSVAYHLVIFALAVWWNVSVGAFFGLAFLRSWLLPGRGLRPKQVGILEIVLSCLLLVTIGLSR